jgi:hypothetical protein
MSFFYGDKYTVLNILCTAKYIHLVDCTVQVFTYVIALSRHTYDYYYELWINEIIMKKYELYYPNF